MNNQLFEVAYQCMLSMHHKSGVGHLGSSLSAFDCIMTLFHEVMDNDDRFILSKGHAASALYAALWSTGQISSIDIDSFCAEGTNFPMHPHGKIPSVVFPTGSLGHGPSLSCGLALAAKHQKSSRHIWCLCGDGEWQEGACWEALIFALHHKLGNMTFIIDANGLQGFGKTNEVAVGTLEIEQRLTSFGCSVRSIDGHCKQIIAATLKEHTPDIPSVILLKTVKGKGLQNEGEVSCHYLPISSNDYDRLMGPRDA